MRIIIEQESCWRQVVSIFSPITEFCDEVDFSAIAKAAYLELAKQYHPDVSDDPDATKWMQLINNAWDEAVKHFETEESYDDQK